MKKLNRKLSVAALVMALTSTVTLATQDEKENEGRVSQNLFSSFLNNSTISTDEDEAESVKSPTYSSESDSDEDSIEENMSKQKNAFAAEKSTSESVTGFWGRVTSFFAPLTNLLSKIKFVLVG